MNRVIVVEDDAHNALVFSKLIQKRTPFGVVVTESPAELFDLISEGGVVLVLMDVSLRDSQWNGHSVNGVELCRAIKDRPATAHVPVLLATAHAMRGDAERLLADSGADGYLAKPVVDHGAFVEMVMGLARRAA